MRSLVLNKTKIHLIWPAIVAFVLVFCADVSAVLRPRADIGTVSYGTDRHPLTREDIIEFSVSTRQQGYFFGHLVMYAEIEDEEGEKYFASFRGKFSAHNGDAEYLRVTDFYISTGEDPDLKAYWIGYYYVDSTGEYLLDEKEQKVSDLEKWIEKVKSYKQVDINTVGAALVSDTAGPREALLPGDEIKKAP